MRIFPNANYDFVGKRKYAFYFSTAILTLGLVSLLVRGVALGIDFKGGTELIVETAQPVESGALRSALASVLGEAPEVKEFGSPRQHLVRTIAAGDQTELNNRVTAAVDAAIPGAAASILQTDTVGPRFADDLRRSAILSVLFGLAVVFIYVMIRFEWTYSVGAVAALAHDVLFTLGMFSLLEGIMPFSLQVDQTIIAAFLTLVGFSLNDTVIVFDRMREYTALFKSEPFDRIINRATNAMLGRTMITNGSVLLTIVVLFIFGGDVIRPFAFALLLGMSIGTYSSVFVAAPIVLALRERMGGRTRPALARG